jgi:hypothetical protein
MKAMKTDPYFSYYMNGQSVVHEHETEEKDVSDELQSITSQV